VRIIFGKEERKLSQLTKDYQELTTKYNQLVSAYNDKMPDNSSDDDRAQEFIGIMYAAFKDYERKQASAEEVMQKIKLTFMTKLKDEFMRAESR